MADENYARLLPGRLGLAALIPQKRGRGGRRPGAGRPKGSGSKVKPPTPTKTCACGALVAAGRSAYCEPCAQRRIAAKERKCDHPKPLLSSGRERKVCFDCAPKPTKGPRKPTKYRSATPAVCEADGCGAAYTKRLPSERFCSDRCRLRVHARKVQERRRNSDPRPCRWCGDSFVPEYGSLRIAYCTLDCKAKAKRKLRSGSSHRRRAARFGCRYEPVSKRKVFERDGWRCYLCGCETPKELSGTKDPRAPELEHVVPLSKRGPHSYDNVRCACRSCNRRKGARSPAVA